MTPTGWTLAVALFLTVALGVISLALAWEGIRAVLRRRKVQRELQKVSRRSLESNEKAAEDILREEKTIPKWAEPLVVAMPRVQDIQRLVTQADSSWSVGTFILLTAGFGAGAGLAATLLASGIALPILATAIGALLPYLSLTRKRKKRFNEFEKHFPEAIDLMGRAIRAGHAFPTGIRVVADEAEQPIAGEFRQVFEEQRFGLPLRDSLLSLADRIDLVDVRIFVTAVLVQRDTGGNLAEILDNLSHIIRERFKFRRELRTKTAHGRITGFILAVAPFAVGILIYMGNPDYMMVMIEDPRGRAALFTVAAMQVIGILIIRRIIDIEY